MCCYSIRARGFALSVFEVLDKISGVLKVVFIVLGVVGRSLTYLFNKELGLACASVDSLF